MGFAKRYLDKQYEDAPFLEFARALVSRHMLTGAAKGVALQAIDRGLDSLSDKQQYVFYEYVIAENRIEECRACRSRLEIEEMADALDTGKCVACDWLTLISHS